MDLPVNEIVFQQDTADRKYWFKAASFAHPAKMVLGLQLYLIEHYTKKGDTILDPMAGSGTILVACAIGRNVICVELEKKFVKMQQDNWEKIQRLGPMLGYTMGQAQIIQGDARNLDNVLADCAIFSPPYAEALDRDEHKHSGGRVEVMLKDSYLKSKQGKTKGQISNLPYGSISAVISSPPYEGSISGKELPESEKKVERKSGKEKWGKHLRLGQSQLTKYSDKVDVVCTSPPFSEQMQDVKWMQKNQPRKYRATHDPKRQLSDNIGNLKSDSYLEAMLLVYQGCYKVLKPEGLMILVTKNFIRNKAIVRLDSDTIKLCEQAGFTLTERLKRKLTQQSFWRRIYMQKYPDAPKIDFEDVLVFSRA